MSAQLQLEVHNVVMRYCRAVDRCDWDLLRSVYHEDATIDHGKFQGGVEGFVDFVKSRRVGIVHSAHYVGNVFVERIAEHEAAVEVYGWAVQTFKSPSELVASGFQGVRLTSTYRYVDRVEKRDSRWAMAECHLVLGDLQVEHLSEEPGPRPGQSQRPSTDDPMYALHQNWFGS